MDIKKYLHSPFFYLLLMVIGYFGFTKITDTDFGFHLAQGKYFFEHNGQLPLKEIYSYTIVNQKNIILSWLFDAGIYFSYLKLGFWGISLWKSLTLASLALLFILRLEKLAGAKNIRLNEWFSYGTVLLFIAAVYPWANLERPHVLGYIFFSLFLLIINDFLKNPQRWHWLFFVLLQILWVNSHTSFTVSMIVITIFITGLYWEWLGKRKTTKPRQEMETTNILKQIKFLFCLLGLVILASLANPYGFDVFLNFFKASPSGAYKFIQELWPMRLAELWSIKGLFWLLSIVPLANFWRQRNHKMVLLFVAFAFLGINSSRFSFDYVVLSAPFTVLEIFSFWPIFFNKLLAGLGLSLVASLAFAMVASQKDRGAGFSANDFPIGAANFILQNNLSGKMYNSFGAGSYLIWHLYPKYQVFIDTRAQNYVEGGINSLLSNYYRFMGDVSAWQKLDEKYNFDFAVVDWPFVFNGKNYNSTEQNFTSDKWALVFMDNRALVYLKRTAVNKPLIGAYEYKYIKPQKLDLAYFQEYLKTPYEWLSTLQELRRALEQSPNNYRLHFMYAAFLAQNPSADKEEIVAHLKHTIDLNHRFSQARKVLKTLFNVNY